MSDFKRITSKENSLIKLISSLQTSSKSRKESSAFVLEGLRISNDAFDNGIKFDKLIVSDTALQKYKYEINKLCKNSNDSYLLPDSLFKKISDTSSPQGIIAVAKIPVNNEASLQKSGKYIALENLNNPTNLGAISRTAEALGVSGIILSNGGCDPYSPKTLRASMGTILRMPIFIYDNFIESIKKSGLKTFACVVDSDATAITDAELSAGSVVIIGNEANGITTETKAACDRLVTIPMSGRAESLNASVAATIAIWEMMK